MSPQNKVMLMSFIFLLIFFVCLHYQLLRDILKSLTIIVDLSNFHYSLSSFLIVFEAVLLGANKFKIVSKS